MGLKSEIMESMKAAMKDRDKVRVAAIRLIRDAIQKAEIDSNKELDDAGVLALLAKLIKSREESIEAYEKGGRSDLAERERTEIDLIREFMPPPLSEDELSKMVGDAIEEAGARGPSDMGKVMKTLKGRYEGRASGKAVSTEVKKQLAESRA